MPRTGRLPQESGAVIIHVALALLGLIVFTVLAVDYGVMWVSRTQAQAAADAGALAGAISLAYGPPAANPRDRNDPVNQAAREAAEEVSARNAVWGRSPGILVDRLGLDSGQAFPCPPDATARICGGTPGCLDQCVQVDAYRNQPERQTYSVADNEPLGTFFARLLAAPDDAPINSQGVRATATAAVLSGSIVPRCMKPFALADRWMEGSVTPPRPSIFGDFYDSPPDSYDPEVTRWKWPDDLGATVIIHQDSQNRITSSWAQLLDPGPTGSISVAVYGCTMPGPLEVGTEVPLKSGGTEGLRLAVKELADLYASTQWNHADKHLECGPDNCDNPRVGAIPIVDPSKITTGSSVPAKVIDIVGIYIEGLGHWDGMTDLHPELLAYKVAERQKMVVAHLVPVAALPGGGSGPPRPSSFARTVVLIR